MSENGIWTIRTSIQTHTCHGINHDGHCNVDEEFISIEILLQFRPIHRLNPRSSRIISKMFMGSASAIKKPSRSRTQFTLHRPLYRQSMTMIPKLKIAMPSMSYLPPLVILPEDQRSVESMVSMRNIQNVYSNARDVMRLGIRVGLVVKQLIIKSVA